MLGGLAVNQAAWYFNTKRILKESHLRYEKLHSGTLYLIHVLEENDVPLTDFDAIAFQELVKGRDS